MERRILQENESRSSKLPGSNEKPKMTYFRRFRSLEYRHCQRMQRKKASNLGWLPLSINPQTSFSILRRLIQNPSSILKRLAKIKIQVSEESDKAFQTLKSLMRYRSKSATRVYIKIFGFLTGKPPLPPFLGKYVNHLQSLVLNLVGPFMHSDKEVKGVVDNVKRSLATIRNFNLFCESCQNLTEPGVSSIVKLLSKGQALQQLNMMFTTDVNIDYKFSSPIAIEKKIDGLQHFGIKFHKMNKITNQTIQFLSILLESKKSLRSLALSFYYSENLDDEGLVTLGEKFGTSFQSLQYLKLNFSGSSVSDEGLKVLVESIGSNLPGLKHLILHFDDCMKITDEGIRVLDVEFRKRPKRFRSLKFSFEDSGLTNQKDETLRLLESFCTE